MNINPLQNNYDADEKSVTCSIILSNSYLNHKLISKKSFVKNTEFKKEPGQIDDLSDKIFLFIEDIDPNFTSRDLIRLFVTLSKQREISGDFSLKGIRYWINLSSNQKYKVLYNKYKPWSLHTAYKRIFSYSTVEEVIGILKNNPKADLRYITKMMKLRKEKARPKIKINNSPLMENSVTCSLKQSNKNFKKKQRFRIFKKSSEKSKYSLKSINSREIEISHFDMIKKPNNSSLDKCKGINDFFENVSNNCYWTIIQNVENNKNFRILKNKLSDMYDVYNNQINNCYQNLNDYDINNKFYITVTNVKEQIRIFYDTKLKEKEYKTTLLSLLYQIREEFSNYSESFIIESLMRLSNDINDLRYYLSDPLKNSYLLWSEVEDQILFSEINDFYFRKLLEVKGEDRIKKRIKFLNDFKSDLI